MWVDVHTLPGTNPLGRIAKRIKHVLSITSAPGGREVERRTAIINGDYHPGLVGAMEGPPEDSDGQTNRRGMRRVDASCCCEQLGEERHGGSWWSHSEQEYGTQPVEAGSFLFTLGKRTEQNPFSGELAAIAYALRNLPDSNRQNIAIFSRNKGAVAALSRPYQQSGQEFIECIYDSVEELCGKAKTVAVGWDSPDKNRLLQVAKRQAKAATQQGAEPEAPSPVVKTTTLNNERMKLLAERCISEGNSYDAA